MRGPAILARTMSRARRLKKNHPCDWQYHPRSDHHSKVACWGVLFDLLLSSDLLREHAAEGRIAFGINHDLRDHTNNRKKSLDLVVCRPAAADAQIKRQRDPSFAELATKWQLELTEEDRAALADLPNLHRRPVGTTLMALEAKALFTEFAKARPRLYDELASSHVVVHGDTDSAIAIGLALINTSSRFTSPTRNPCLTWGAPRVESVHNQPRETVLSVQKIAALPRREMVGKPGFDAIAALTLECVNDGTTPVVVVTDPARGAVPVGDALHYATLVNRSVGIYHNRFPRA